MAVEKAIKERTKVVLRHIPPGFSSESLLALLTSTLDPFPKYDFYHFAPVDYSLDPFLSCRAYFNFVDPSSVFAFKEKFDGQKFIDCNKVQMVGIVEYAPFQRVPKRIKKDVRSGTIEKDSDYLEFLEELKIEPEAPPSIEMIMDEIEKRRVARAEEQSSTALLEYIKNRRAERSLSPHSKSQFRRDRPGKLEDNRRYKGTRSRGRNNSEEDSTNDYHRKPRSDVNQSKKEETEPRIIEKREGRSSSSRGNNEEFRSRNNVKSERSSKSYTSKGKALPEKAIYVPGKKKTEETGSKFILSSKNNSQNNENRESVKDKERSENDSKSKNYNNNCDRYNSRDIEDRQSYRREGYENDRNDRSNRDRDYERDNDYYDYHGYRGNSYRGSRGYRGGWRDDRGRGRGRARGRSSRGRN